MRKPVVFVVDDEAQICTLLTRILEREGYAVRAFSAPEEAVAAAETERPDVVVTDLMMPGVSGLELVRRIREKLPGVRAVLTTGYASVDTVVDAMRSGVDDFVTKPFSVADIRAVVARALQASRDAPAGAPVAAQETTPAASPALVRHVRDMGFVESAHELLADEIAVADIAPRCAPMLAAALDVVHCAVLAKIDAPPTFRVRSAAPSRPTWPARLDIVSPALVDLAASGVAAVVDRAALGPAAADLADGPVAAAPLRARPGGDPDAGLLVVSRKSRNFEAEDLRVLAVVATAVGDVWRAARAAERAEDAYFRSLCDVVAATESRCPWFARHGERVQELSLRLGRRVGLADADLDVLEMAARLLDLGRVETPDRLLGKEARPTDDEWRALRRHVVCSDEMIRPLGRLRRVKPVVRHHHENWDGTGYPDGLAGEAIPHLAAIVRIADAYAALTSKRAWREALAPDEAVRQIVEKSGSSFHPRLVAAFADAARDETRRPDAAS